jgi:hypothetical protein
MPDQKPALRLIKGGLSRAQSQARESKHPSRQSIETEPIPGADRQRRPKHPIVSQPPVCMIPGCGCTGDAHP